MNRTAARLTLAAAVLALSAALAAAGDSSQAPAKKNAAWESMKNLQGEWEGFYGGKLPTRVSYRLVSNGTALMESLVSPDSSDMVTMYHPDGDRLAMTHYCSEKTQSRMRASSADAKRIAFSFVDASNLSAPDAMRMTGLVITVQDKDHFTQEWTSTGRGKSETGRFEFTRKK